MRKLLVFSVLCCSSVLVAQDQIGIANSNYAGTDGVAFSPARTVYQWQFADIKLLGAGVNVWNNYVFLAGRSRTAFGELTGGLQGNGSFDLGRIVNDRNKKAAVLGQVEGPSATIGFGRNAFGLHVTGKAQLTVSGVSPEIGNFIWEGLNYAPQHGFPYSQENLRITYNAYTEIGGNFSRQLFARGHSLFSAGVTVKYLIGHSGGGILLSNLDYEVHDSVALTVDRADGEFGFAQPAFVAGKGIGADVGIHYQRTIEEVNNYVPHSVPYGCEPMAYRYRFSLSLLDVGSVKYSNANAGVFDGAVGNIANYNTLSVSNEVQVDSLINNTLSGVRETAELRVGLSTAFAAQADLRLANRFFLSANIIQPVGGRSHLRTRRNAYLALAPRFETERFEVATPIVWREYQKPVLGLMLRLNSIVIGSDDVFPWLSRSSNVYGADIYAKVKITLFRKRKCKDRRAKSKADVAMEDKEALPCVIPK